MSKPERTRRSIDSKSLMKDFSIFCIENDISAKSYQEAYVLLVNQFESDGAVDTFNIVLEKVSALIQSFDLVKKHSDFEATDVESFIYMVSAYSQRMVAYGEMLYGGITDEVANHFTGLSFTFAQQNTFHNKEFQNASLLPTFNLLATLDPDINLDGFFKYTTCAAINKKQINFPYENKNYIEWDVLLQFFNKVSEMQELPVDLLNEFINNNQKPNMQMRD